MTELEPLPPATSISYDNSKPALLFGSDRDSMAKAASVLLGAGVRLVDQLPISAAEERLDGQASLGLVWLELGDGDEGPALERLLGRLDHLADYGTITIAAAPPGLIDVAAAHLTHRNTDILIDPDEAQRVAALAISLSGVLEEAAFADVTRDNAARLQQLSDEMGRIASTLARLSTGPGAEAALKLVPKGAAAPTLEADVVRSVIRARRLRSRYFSEELFADPAWDMLLDLLQAEIAQLRVPVSSLCIAASVPATTALRWIKTMTEQGLFLRRADPHDGRRVFVELAPAASDAMRRYFAEVGKPVVV